MVGKNHQKIIMSNNTPIAQEATEEEASEARLEAQRRYRTRVNEWQKGKAMFLLGVSMWSGRKVQSDTELQALGIEDIKAYKETRSRGSKMLVPQSSLQPITKIKYSLEKGLMSLARRRATFSNVYFFPQENLNDAVRMVMNADRQMKQAVESYLEDPTGYDNDREIMIQRHMAEVGNDQLRTLVEQRVVEKGDPPEGISETEWWKQARADVIERFNSPQEVAEALGLNYDTFAQEYPPKEYIRAAYGISFEILPLPYETKLDQLLEEYELEKLAEGVAEDTAKARADLRKMLVDALVAFRKTMREKDASEKINNRTITRVREVFDQFQAIGQMLGDTGEVHNLIEGCKMRFEQADAWTVEEAKALGIEGALEGLIEEANGMVIDIYQHAEEEGEMFADDYIVDDDVGDIEREDLGIESREMST